MKKAINTVSTSNGCRTHLCKLQLNKYYIRQDYSQQRRVEPQAVEPKEPRGVKTLRGTDKEEYSVCRAQSTSARNLLTSSTLWMLLSKNRQYLIKKQSENVNHWKKRLSRFRPTLGVQIWRTKISGEGWGAAFLRGTSTPSWWVKRSYRNFGHINYWKFRFTKRIIFSGKLGRGGGKRKEGRKKNCSFRKDSFQRGSGIEEKKESAADE